MSEKGVLTVFIATLIVGSMLGFASCLVIEGQKFSEMDSQLKTLNGQNAYLQSITSTLETQIQKVDEKQIQPLKNQITSLLNEKTALESQIQILQNQLTATSATEKTQLTQQINDLQTQVSQKNTQIIQLNNQITSLQTSTQTDTEIIKVSFSNTEDTSAILREWISKANHTVKLMIYCITQDQLADALILAKNRGIDVDAVVDDTMVNTSGSDYERLLDAGLDIRNDSDPNMMHHKVMIVDGEVVATGSYNWSANAEDSSYENVMIIRGQTVANQYLAEFDRIWGNTASSIKNDPINILQLSASYSYSVNGLSATFTDTSQDDVSVVSWSWSFGDAQTSSQRSPAHVYSSGGTYHVTLSVGDSDGHTSSVSHDITVSAGSTPANGPFWGSKNSDKYHYPTCSSAQQIHSENLRIFSSSTEARNAGYVPCQICNPP